MCMHTEVEFFFPVNFLSILNIIKEVIIKNKSNNYVSFFFKWKQIWGYQTRGSYLQVAFWRSVQLLLPNERAVLSNHVTSRGRIKKCLNGDFTAIGPSKQCSSVAWRDPQTLILYVFPSIPRSKLKMAENSLILLMKDGVCFLPSNLWQLWQIEYSESDTGNFQAQVLKAWQLPFYFL